MTADLRALQGKLRRLLSLSNKATKGPWRKFTSIYGNDTVAIMKGDAPRYNDSGDRVRKWSEIITWMGFDGSDTSETRRHADARLLVAAVNFVREDIPALLDEIEAKDARIAELEAALKPFAKALNDWGDDTGQPDRWNVWEHPVALNITLGDVRRASQVLSQSSTKGDAS